MGEIQTISYVGVSNVGQYPDMDNDQYNIRRFKNYCFNNEFLCHFEDGNITPDGLLYKKTSDYYIQGLATTTPITPNTVYTFISYHHNVSPIQKLRVYCNNGANLVAEFPLGNNGISLVTGITPGTITDQNKFNLYNFPGGSYTIELGWIMVLPYVANNWPLPALWCKTGANILNTGMGVNKGHILVSNTYTEGFAPSNNINMGEPCFYYLDDTMLPPNLQGNEPMILYNGRRSATLPDAISNEDAILKIQQNQNLLIYDADMSDYVYYNMENTTLLFDFGNLNTYDGSNTPPRIYNLKNTLWGYYLINNNLGSGLRVNHTNGNPSSKSFQLQGKAGFYNNSTNTNLAISPDGYFVIGVHVRLHPITNGEIYKTIIELKPSIKLLWAYNPTQQHYVISLMHNNNIMCSGYIAVLTPVSAWATIVAGRITDGRYCLFVNYMVTNSGTSQPLIATNGQLRIGADEVNPPSDENGGLQFGLIQMWRNYNLDYNNFTTFSVNFASNPRIF